MAASSIVKNLNDGSISVADGTTPTPVSLAVDFDQGDLNLSGLAETQNEVVAYESRGVLKSLRHTARTYPSGSLTIMMTEFTDATDQLLIDFIMQQGSYSGNVSTVSGGVYCIDITLTIEGTDSGDDEDHTLVLEDCYCTIDFAEGDPNTLTINFTVYGNVTMT